MGFENKTTTFHVHCTFLYISLPFLHDYVVKLPNFTCCGRRKQATTKLYNLDRVVVVELQRGLPIFDKVNK